MRTPENTHVALTAETSLWCVAATLSLAPSIGSEGATSPNGTKHFKPGAKVYAIDTVPNEPENLVVLGHHRKSRQFVKGVVLKTTVEDPRLEEVVIPTVMTLAKKHAVSSGTPLTRERAEVLLQSIVERGISHASAR